MWRLSCLGGGERLVPAAWHPGEKPVGLAPRKPQDDPPTAGAGAHHVFRLELSAAEPRPSQVRIEWGHPSECDVPNLTYPPGNPGLERMLTSPDRAKRVGPANRDTSRVPPHPSQRPPYDAVPWHTTAWVPNGQLSLTNPGAVPLTGRSRRQWPCRHKISS